MLLLGFPPGLVQGLLPKILLCCAALRRAAPRMAAQCFALRTCSASWYSGSGCSMRVERSHRMPSWSKYERQRNIHPPYLSITTVLRNRSDCWPRRLAATREENIEASAWLRVCSGSASCLPTLALTRPFMMAGIVGSGAHRAQLYTSRRLRAVAS